MNVEVKKLILPALIIGGLALGYLGLRGCTPTQAAPPAIEPQVGIQVPINCMDTDQSNDTFQFSSTIPFGSKFSLPDGTIFGLNEGGGSIIQRGSGTQVVPFDGPPGQFRLEGDINSTMSLTPADIQGRRGGTITFNFKCPAVPTATAQP